MPGSPLASPDVSTPLSRAKVENCAADEQVADKAGRAATGDLRAGPALGI